MEDCAAADAQALAPGSLSAVELLVNILFFLLFLKIEEVVNKGENRIELGLGSIYGLRM